jgi:hypothetical protein
MEVIMRCQHEVRAHRHTGDEYAGMQFESFPAQEKWSSQNRMLSFKNHANDGRRAKNSISTAIQFRDGIELEGVMRCGFWSLDLISASEHMQDCRINHRQWESKLVFYHSRRLSGPTNGSPIAIIVSLGLNRQNRRLTALINRSTP